MSASTSSDVANQSSQEHPDRLQQQFVCVKRPDSSLTAVFEHMYLNERLVDVTLSCSNGQLQAHKLVLAACSPYFSSLFDKLANPFHYPVVVIKDMQFEDLKLLVEFMYRGQLTINHERLTDLVKCAENLQITGLSSLDTLVTTPIDKNDGNHMATINVEGPKIPSPGHRAMLKRSKRSTSSSFNHQVIFSRTYQRSIEHNDADDYHRPTPDKLLEQSMLTSNDALDVGGQFTNTAYAIASNSALHPTSTKNLIATHSHNHINSSHNHQSHGTPVSSLQHIQHHLGIDNHQLGGGMNQQHSSHNLSNQLQVLSQSLAANRATVSSNVSNGNNGGTNGQANHSHHSSHSHHTTSASNNSNNSSLIRGRVHPCNICWKTFREKANLKRHLQVHSLDRVVYACPDCNKTFSWKDNYIRHTKTAHHMNNVTRQQGT